MFVLYRLPPSTQNGFKTATFFGEFFEFISKHVATKAEIIIVGDLNLHLDINTNPHTRQFTNLLACSGLKQHVNDPTHILGHTLDILITRDTSDVVCNVEVVDIGLSDNDGNVIRDGYAITCFITQQIPATSLGTVSYRKLKSINVDSFRNDIQVSSSLNDSSGTLDEITTRYVSSLNDLIDKHAPLLQRTITVRSQARWYDEQLRDAKHVRRQLERKWRHGKTKSDYEAYRKQCSIVAKELYTTKSEFYSNKIIDNQGDYKALFNIANTLLVNKKCATMPSSDDDSVLASNFMVSDFISDHRVIHVSLKCMSSHPVRKLINFRSLNRINEGSLVLDLDNIDISSECTDVNVLVKQYDDSLSRILDKHAP